MVSGNAFRAVWLANKVSRYLYILCLCVDYSTSTRYVNCGSLPRRCRPDVVSVQRSLNHCSMSGDISRRHSWTRWTPNRRGRGASSDCVVVVATASAAVHRTSSCRQPSYHCHHQHQQHQDRQLTADAMPSDLAPRRCLDTVSEQFLITL